MGECSVFDGAVKGTGDGSVCFLSLAGLRGYGDCFCPLVRIVIVWLVLRLKMPAKAANDKHNTLCLCWLCTCLLIGRYSNT